MARFRGHISEIRIQTGSKTILPAAHRSYKGARLVERQRCDAAAKAIPNAVLMQELFDVGKIKRGNLSAIISEIFSDGTDGFRSRKIPDHRHDKVFAFEGF